MILQIVTFPDAPAQPAETILADARATVARWQSEGELVSKTYARRDDGAMVGLYVWKSRRRAEETHDAAWAEAAFRRMGVRPQISYADVFMVVDNASGTVGEWPLNDAI